MGLFYASTIRVVMGGCQAALFPAVYVLLCQWLPPSERSQLLAFPSAFSRFGTIVMYLTVPPILASYGWETVFYVCGFATLAWSFLFLVLVSNSPDQSNWLSKRERLYIETHMEPRLDSRSPARDTKLAGGSELELAKRASVDWIRLVSNKPIWFLTLVMFASEWSNMLLLIKLTSFLGGAMKMDLTEVSCCGCC